MTTGDLHRDGGPILSMEYSYVWVTVPKLTGEKCENNNNQATTVCGSEREMLSLNMTDVTLPVCSVILTENTLCRKSDQCIFIVWGYSKVMRWRNTCLRPNLDKH